MKVRRMTMTTAKAPVFMDLNSSVTGDVLQHGKV
jgi:hypothetical protein